MHRSGVAAAAVIIHDAEAERQGQENYEYNPFFGQ
jgi:hypothetical protein